MASLDEISAALTKADAAGNADDARALAAAYRAEQARQSSGPVKYQPSNIGGVDTGILDHVNAFGNSMVEAIPIVGPGLADFGRGVDAAWASMIEGKPVTKEDRKRIDDAQREAMPVESFAGSVTGTIAPFVAAGGIPGAARLLGMSGTLPARMGFGAGSGALIGGIDSLARGGNAEDAIWAGATGAGLGASLPLVEKGVKLGWNAIRGNPIVAKPAATVASGITRDRLTPQQIDDMFAALGDDAVLGDLGVNLQGQTKALATLPGEAQTIIADVLQPRQAGRNARIVDDVNANLGPAPVPSRVDASIVAAQRGLSPVYTEVFRGARAVDTQPLAESIEADIVNRRGDAQRALEQVRRMLDVTGAPGNLDPNPYTLFQTRNAIDGMLETEANTKVIAALGDVRRQIDEILTGAVPRIKEADAQFEELARQREGLNYGRTTLGSGPTAPTPADLADVLAESVQPKGVGVGPSAEPLRIIQGNRAEIERIIGTTGNNLTALKTALKGDGSWNRQRLVQLYGQDRADRLLDVLEREVTFDTTYQQAFGNSKTASAQAAQKEMSTEVGGLPTSTTLTGLAAAAATKAAAAGLAANKTGINAEIARILMSGGRLSPEMRRAVAEAIQAARPSMIAPATGGLLATEPKKEPIRITVTGGARQ